MDGSRFDTLARAVAGASTRRRVLAATLGMAAGGALTANDAAAAGRTCRLPGQKCITNAQCCSSICDTARTTPRVRRNRCICPNGLTGCNGACHDVQSSREHCGACGNACGIDETCCAGLCKNLDTDAAHCGGCGDACPAGNACCGGDCTLLATDLANCGSCGNVCTGLQDVCTSGACVCVPDCDAKICGDDGCGGTCGSCAAGNACLKDQTVCDWPCTEWEAGGATNGCSGAIDGERLDGYAWHYWHKPDKACTANSECQDTPFCTKAGYACHCQLSIKDAEDYPDGASWTGGYCVVVATSEPACYNGGLNGQPDCVTTTEAESFGVGSWVTTSGFASGGAPSRCGSSQECINRQSALCATSGQRCVCAVDDYYTKWETGYEFSQEHFYCYRVTT